MKDPKITLKELLETYWNLDFKPTFTTDWYNAGEEMPQIVISQIITKPGYLGFSEQPSTATRKFNALYSVDVWSRGDQEKRHRMVEEVDRILHERCSSPGGDLEFLEVSSWRDLDEVETHPRIYRSRLEVSLHYYC